MKNKFFTDHLDKESILKKIDEPDETLKGLPRGEVGILIAPGATGKSYFVLNIMLAACGLTKNHLVEKPLKTMYISLEDRLDDINRRLSYYKEALNIDESKLNSMSNNFVIFAYKGIERLIVKDYTNEHSLLWNELDDILTGNSPDLIIVDTLIKTYEGYDENSNPDMSKVLSYFNELAMLKECSILLLHHTNKSAVNTQEEQSQTDSRGASSIVDNSRWVLSLKKNNDDSGVVSKSVKMNFTSANTQNYIRKYKGALIMEDEDVA